VVFVAGHTVDGPVELRFKAWELDELGDMSMIPFQVKLSIKGIPQHAWSQDIAEKVLYDEAVIHHVEEITRRKVDQWAF
jgi:hypothetical protein